MKIVPLDSWEGFKSKLDALFAETQKLRIETSREVSTPVFRGHADSAWKLETTWQREFPEEMRLEYFYSNLFYPSLRMLRGAIDFDLPQLSDYNLNPEIRDIPHLLPMSDRLAWLRHHGAPSPLLDWTSSPYVAAFFAFTPLVSHRTSKVAIFAFRESLGQGKGYQGNKPHIGLVGRWAPVHSRHIRQQSLYTVCVKDSSGKRVFASHEEAEADRPFGGIVEFDEITKFEIPSSERKHALEDLNKMNVTEYSLFETQDALIRTVVRFASGPD
jgi:hypothetical protein